MNGKVTKTSMKRDLAALRARSEPINIPLLGGDMWIAVASPREAAGMVDVIRKDGKHWPLLIYVSTKAPGGGVMP